MLYVEILTESRGFAVTSTSTDWTLAIRFKLPMDEMDPEELATPVFTTTTVTGSTDDAQDILDINDDILALETAYSIIPIARWVPNQAGNPLYLILQTIDLSEVDNYGWWKATAKYRYDDNTGSGGEPQDDGNALTLPYVRVGFSVGNRTKHIDTSLEVISSFSKTGDPRNPPDTGKLIGVTEDQVVGADIAAGGLSLNITAYYFPWAITFDLLDLMAATFPCVNTELFLGYAAGEVLILGCDGQATIDDVVPITFAIEVIKNKSNVTDLPFPTLTMKGHHLLDYRTEKNYSDDAKALVQTPLFRFVHRVYEEKDLDLLGFPTDRINKNTTTTAP